MRYRWKKISLHNLIRESATAIPYRTKNDNELLCSNHARAVPLRFRYWRAVPADILTESHLLEARLYRQSAKTCAQYSTRPAHSSASSERLHPAHADLSETF